MTKVQLAEIRAELAALRLAVEALKPVSQAPAGFFDRKKAAAKAKAEETALAADGSITYPFTDYKGRKYRVEGSVKCMQPE